MTLDLADDTGTNLIIGYGSVLFWIGYHDQIKGKSKDPLRVMPPFEIDDVFETEKELKEKGVQIIANAQLSPTKDFYYLTIQDLDDNTINLYSFNLKND
ncbi:MAG: hypothetical protein Q9M91_04265 [Candidatus Dojkabacteria bacterium]|nr:hypothetical protein [Candidatus Dojkabacteria bacterium]MDQ7021028.1 hypothetical protein [Candidatus Dojkabacteria bacterium]